MSDLLREISVNAPCEKVYSALATQNGLRGWWTTDSTMEGDESAEALNLISINAPLFSA